MPKESITFRAIGFYFFRGYSGIHSNGFFENQTEGFVLCNDPVIYGEKNNG